MPSWKLDFVLEFIKHNKRIDDFVEIQLFPMSASWSGSEVPLIIDKIDFLKALEERLKGIDYIEHRKHIDELIRNLETHKENVELREYVEMADYA